MCDGLVRSSAIAWITLEQVWRRRVYEVTNSDNTAAVSTVKSGVSKKLAYLRRTQKVSIGFAADYVGSELTKLRHVPTEQQYSDVFTKFLDVRDFWRCLQYLGID